VRETRLGLIGVGPWGRNYVRTIQAIDQTKLTAVVSGNPATPELAGPTCSIYTTWQDLLESEAVDGIIVATPPSTHATIAEAAVYRRCPILVEKPVALNLEDADRLVKLAAANAAIVHVDHTDLRNPALNALRHFIAGPADIRRLRGAWSNQGPLRPDIRGLWDYGAHAIAVCLDLMGARPDNVGATWSANSSAGELADVRLGWGEVTAALEIGNASATRNRWLEIDTESHRLRYDDIADRKALVDDREIDYPETRPLTVAVERFIAAIQRGVADTSDLELGCAAVRTLAAVENALEVSA